MTNGSPDPPDCSKADLRLLYGCSMIESRLREEFFFRHIVFDVKKMLGQVASALMFSMAAVAETL